MAFTKIDYPTDKKEFYQTLKYMTIGLLEDEKICTTALANLSALLYDALENINWAGFYMTDGETLYLAPFMGKPACTKISKGKGVCGTAFETKEIQLVKDVHLFSGHIACDSASESEIVIPLILNGNVIGVLDIDAPIKNRFDQEDLQGLSQIVDVLLEKVDFSNYKII